MGSATRDDRCTSSSAVMKLSIEKRAPDSRLQTLKRHNKSVKSANTSALITLDNQLISSQFQSLGEVFQINFAKESRLISGTFLTLTGKQYTVR